MHDGVCIDLWWFGVTIHEYGEEILMKKIHREKTEIEKIIIKYQSYCHGDN